MLIVIVRLLFGRLVKSEGTNKIPTSPPSLEESLTISVLLRGSRGMTTGICERLFDTESNMLADQLGLPEMLATALIEGIVEELPVLEALARLVPDVLALGDAVGL